MESQHRFESFNPNSKATSSQVSLLQRSDVIGQLRQRCSSLSLELIRIKRNTFISFSGSNCRCIRNERR
jgi:hypothetical protein